MRGITYEDGTSVRFRKNGRVEEGRLARDTKIKGITYTWSIHFYANGRLKEGRLARDTKIRGITYEGGDSVKFHESGRVERGGARGRHNDKRYYL